MSHFTVVVIGPDVPAQLQPYHEFECTGENDQYVQDIDVTEECREKGLDWYGLEDCTVLSEEDIDRSGDHQFGYAIVDAEGNLVKAVNRTNPNAQWDWYQTGGRWSGFFKLKEGGVGAKGTKGLMGSCTSSAADAADILRKGAIDFERMRSEAEAEAAVRWDKAFSAHKGEPWLSWDTCRNNHSEYIDGARAQYNEQHAIKAIKAAFPDSYWLQPDDFLAPRAEYLAAARNSAAVPYAVVQDGKWYAKGKMGWFGMSDDRETDAYWAKQVNDMYDALPADTLLTVVDCHI